MTIADEGVGRALLVVHGGMGDLRSWQRVTDRLRPRFRTLRLHRRQYRLDVARPVSMADEVAEVRRVAAGLDRPVLIGHSSGAVLALEVLAADPAAWSAAVLYEPPLVVGRPFGLEHVARARAALAAGRPGTAFAVFLREVAELRSPLIPLAAFAMNRRPGRMAALVERQLDDHEAIARLGDRRAAYGVVDVPVLLLTGGRSPQHLLDRADALQQVLPRASRRVLPGQGHNAERTAPARVAAAIDRFL